TFGPKGSETSTGAVEPYGKALFEEFHEPGNVAHERELTLTPSDGFGAILGQLGLDHLQLGELVFGGLRIKHAEAAEQLGVGNLLPLGHTHEDMEVIGHQREGQHLHPAV